MAKQGLFIGLTTLDLIYQIEAIPQQNQKIVAQHYTLAAGGPATNAAVAFRYLGSHRATVLAMLGQHPLSQLIQTELQSWQVQMADLDADRRDPPPTSSILVTQATGDRAVVSLNARQTQATPEQIPAEILHQLTPQHTDIVLLDGHQMAVSAAIAPLAKAQNIPMVIDAGSWKPGFEQVLPWADYVIASANFHPPGCQSSAEVMAYLSNRSIPHIAISQGADPILYKVGDEFGEIPVPKVQPVDTLGAGDILHGAFCHYCLELDFKTAIAQAATVASFACQSLGTRDWMQLKSSNLFPR